MIVVAVILSLSTILLLCCNSGLIKYVLDICDWLIHDVSPKLTIPTWFFERVRLIDIHYILTYWTRTLFVSMVLLIVVLIVNIAFVHFTLNNISIHWIYGIVIILFNLLAVNIAIVQYNIFVNSAAQVTAYRAVLRTIDVYNNSIEEHST